MGSITKYSIVILTITLDESLVTASTPPVKLFQNQLISLLSLKRYSMHCDVRNKIILLHIVKGDRIPGTEDPSKVSGI
jgi:hypothetical protein